MGVQTNGTLLSRPMLESLSSLRVSVGVSLDGDAEATGRHRRYANGRNSFGAVAEACGFCGRRNSVTVTAASCARSTPATTRWLPMRRCSSSALRRSICCSRTPTGVPRHPVTGYADWLISVFDRWYSAPRQETQIRLFRELIQLVLGQPGEVEGLGLLPSTLVVVDTDGSIKQLDSLSSAYPGAADTGLHVFSNSFDDALDHPTTVARQIGAAALSAECLECPVMEICGGGLYPHRYRQGAGFRNRSVYCDDLLRLITHVRDRVVADLRRLNALHLGLDLGGQPLPLRCRMRLGMLQVSVSSYLRGRRASRCSALATSPAAASSTDRLAAAISVSG